MNLTKIAELNLEPEEIVKIGISQLRFLEDRLIDCERCVNGNLCKEYSSRKGMIPASENGKLIMKPCGKYQEAMFRRRMERIGISRRFQDCSLENYKPFTKEQRAGMKKCLAYSRIFPTDRGLLISGPVGTGKTHLAIGIVREVMKQNEATISRFVEVPALLAEIRSGFNAGRSTETSPMKMIEQADLLILDDLGAERVTDWVREQLYLVINERYSQMKPTIITTNDSLEELEENVSQRTVSRIMDMCDGILLTGEDFRKKRLRGGAT